MKIALMGRDVTHLVSGATWSGDKTQAARKLEVTLIQDDRDKKIPVLDIDCGYTVQGFDEADNLVFQGNIYDLERDRAKSTVKIICYDNLYVLNRSKTTKKFTDALPEEIASQICGEMGINVGEIAQTGTPVSFIANSKTGYQIILGAYTEAHKKNEKIYQLVMQGDKLNVIEKGTLIEFELDARRNMTESVYRESITELINRVLIVDDKGLTLDAIDDSESQQKYSRFQTIYKEQKDKDTQEGAKDLLTKPKREGNVTALGNYTCVTGYSLMIKDSLFTGQFWIKSDHHTFKDDQHEMKLQLEFENLMQEEKVEHEKPQSEKKSDSTKRKRKDDSNAETNSDG